MTGNGAAQKPRLTEAQKKAHHIQSEQNRREQIRQGFEHLATLVPGMQGRGASEAKMLESTVDFLKAQLDKKKELGERGLEVGMSEADFEHIYRQETKAAEERSNERVNRRRASSKSSGEGDGSVSK